MPATVAAAGKTTVAHFSASLDVASAIELVAPGREYIEILAGQPPDQRRADDAAMAGHENASAG
jgi:hypothetical protein